MSVIVQNGMPDPPRVALCVIATGKYRDFMPRLVRSARQFFLPSCLVTYVALTEWHPPPDLFQVHHRVPAKPWPGPTLYRYRWMLEIREYLERHDYVFYVDVDAAFADVVGEEILGTLVAVQHQGFVGVGPDDLGYERRGASAACVPKGFGYRYYAGGFQGGRATEYMRACKALDAQIARDEQKGVTAAWHDESHWNRHLVDWDPERSPLRVLPPIYCCDEIDRLPGARILALRKDHDRVRAH